MRVRMGSVRALRGRRMIAVLAVPAAAATLAGCASFQSPPTASQDNVIGAADIHTAICLGGFGTSPDPGAYDPIGGPITTPATTVESDPGSGSSDDSDNGACVYQASEPSAGQVLVGYLVPDGATAPQTITAAELGGLTFTQDAAYAQQLTAGVDGAPDPLPGHHWVGYVSGATRIGQNPGDPGPVIHLDAPFGLPAGTGGSPYSGPFVAETVVGDRVVNDSEHAPEDPGTTTTETTTTVTTTTTDALAQATTDDAAGGYDANRPVDCTGDGTFQLSGATLEATDCAEDSASVTLDTRDLRVIAPQPVTVAAGQTASLPFTMAYAGNADPSATFGLRTSSDQPAGSPSAADAHYTPTAAGNGTESVTDAIPASTAPGTYHVTLTAAGSPPACADATQCSRSATATVVVTPASSTGTSGAGGPGTTAIQNAPAPRTVAAPKTLRFSARLVSVGRPRQHKLYARGWRLKLYCNQACVVNANAFVYHGGYYHGRKLPGLQHPTAHIAIGNRVYNLAHAGTKTRYIHLSRAAVTALTRANVPYFRLTVRLYATDAKGGQRTRTVRRQVRIRM